MKADRLLIISVFCLAMTHCEYKVTQPAWYDDFTETTSPSITGIEPAAATAGWNYITIKGTDFSSEPKIYFDNFKAKLLTYTDSSVTVRRPDMSGDSCIVKVVCDNALVVAKYSPYQITSVLEQYGNFLENIRLNVVAVDTSENMFVVDSIKNIYKVTADGQKSIVAEASRKPTDATIGPDGNLYLLENNRAIDKLDVASGTVARWIQMPSGKTVKFGDFDEAGYFYAGGTRTDLQIVNPSLSISSAGYYSADTIQAVRVCGDYVYVAASATGDAAPSIIRHPISSGSVGAPDTVLDLSTTDFSSRVITALGFSADGIMFIATDTSDPILICNPETREIDYFYKDILPAYCKHLNWGGANYLYMIVGDNVAEADWTIYRVDMGTADAP